MLNQEFLTVILHIYLQQVQLNYKHAKPTHITDAYRNIPCVFAKNYNKHAFLKPFVSVYVTLSIVCLCICTMYVQIALQGSFS